MMTLCAVVQQERCLLDPEGRRILAGWRKPPVFTKNKASAPTGAALNGSWMARMVGWIRPMANKMPALLDKLRHANEVFAMKTRIALFSLAILCCASSGWTQSLNQAVASLNADAQKPGGAEHALKSISAATHVPVATLEKEKAASGLSCGDLYAAHAIAAPAGKTFDQIAKQKKSGKTWEQVAADNNVNLGGQKVTKTNKPKARGTPVPQDYKPITPDQSGYRAMP